MGFEDVDERMEWEARRVAAAFKVEGIQSIRPHDRVRQIDWEGYIEGQSMFFCVMTEEGELRAISIATNEGWIQMARAGKRGVDDRWMAASHGEAKRELFARGLYCLGIEEESVWRNLNVIFSAHQKLELRLSMPREFWPKQWLAEEAK